MTDQPRVLISERGLIGMLLADNSLYFELGTLEPEDFAEEEHGLLYSVMRGQIEAGRAVTASTVITDAQDAPVWGNTKASAYIRELEEQAPPPDKDIARELARTIRDTALKTRLLGSIDDFRDRVVAALPTTTAQQLRDQYDESINALFANATDLGLRRLGEVGDTVLEELKGDREVGIPLGLATIQELIGPALPSKLTFISGSPGSGKSALTLQIARNIARYRYPDGSGPGPVVIFSPEMENEEQATRALAGETGIEDYKITRNMLQPPEYERLYEANELLKHENVFLDNSTAPTVAMIRGRSLRLKRIHGRLGAIFIDHCDYLEPPDRKMDEYSSMRHNLKALKQVAKDLRVPIYALVQFKSIAEVEIGKWPHRNPTLGDVAFVAEVNKNADAIVVVHRREAVLRANEPEDGAVFKGQPYHDQWETQCIQWEGKAQAFAFKRRSGGFGFGKKLLGFDAPRYRFTDELPRLARVPEPGQMF